MESSSNLISVEALENKLKEYTVRRDNCINTLNQLQAEVLRIDGVLHILNQLKDSLGGKVELPEKLDKPQVDTGTQTTALSKPKRERKKKV